MTTDDKRFQDALLNLTLAFNNFLDVVNPGGPDRENDIRYIAQTMQNLAAHLATIAPATNEPVTNNSPLQHSQQPQYQQPQYQQPQYQQPQYQQPQTVPPSGIPTQSPAITSNLNLTTKKYDKWPVNDPSGVCMFRSLSESKESYETDKPFVFLLDTNAGEGEFEMEINTQQEWKSAMENQKDVFNSHAVVVRGLIVENGALVTIEKGHVRLAEGSRKKWIIIKPCVIQIITK